MQPADPEVADHLQARTGEPIVVLRRVRLADGKPIALETAHLLHRTCPGILANHDFAHAWLYRVLQDHYGLHLVWATQVIGARMPDRFDHDALDLADAVPVLSLLPASP